MDLPRLAPDASKLNVLTMAKGSKKGACSANVQPAKANCLKHNRRDEKSQKVPSYVNPHRSHLNRTIFEDDMIKGRASIVPLVKRAEMLYTEKTGQKCQKSFVPFREDVLSLPGRGDISDKQIKDYLQQVEEKYGIKPLGAWYHQDEGHVHSKYIEGDEDYETNYHVHVLYDCQDHETGKSIKLPRSFYSLRQDFLAQATGLERGNPAAETGRKRRETAQERIFRLEERIRMMEEEQEKREKKEQEDIKRFEREKSRLERQIASLKAKNAVKEKIMGWAGQSSKDKEIAQLKETIEKEPERTAAAVAEARTETRKEVITEVKKAADLRIGDGGNETAAQIGRAWRRNYDKVKSLEVELKTKDVERHNAIQSATREYQKKAETAQREADIWKERFAKFWPSAIKAIAAIVEKVNSTWQNLFTADQVRDIDAAMGKAESVKERIEWGKDLMDYARLEFTRNEGDTAKQVEDIARNGQNVQKIGQGMKI